MKKIDIKLEQKTIMLISIAVGAVVLAVLLIQPLYKQSWKLSKQVKELDAKMADVRIIFKRAQTIDQNKQLMARNQVSQAINDLVELGSELNISFLSTSPQKIFTPEGEGHPVLPIQLELQSTYKDLGIFLGALETQIKPVVTVRQFSLDREVEILPKLQSNLIVDVHLAEK